MKQLAMYCLEVISKHPKLASEINELFQLCKDEIEQGGSETHEIELCYGSIKELLEEN